MIVNVCCGPFGFGPGLVMSRENQAQHSRQFDGLMATKATRLATKSMGARILAMIQRAPQSDWWE